MKIIIKTLTDKETQGIADTQIVDAVKALLKNGQLTGQEVLTDGAGTSRVLVRKQR